MADAHSFWDGVLNPTYVPSTVARTLTAFGPAGLYAVLTASALIDVDLKARVARYATLRWVLPMAIAMPAAVVWYLSAASAAGVPITEMLVTIVMMVFARDTIRSTALRAAGFTHATWIAPQWIPIALFTLLLVAAVATVGWMARAFAIQSPAEGA